jgi:hypothetical protein
VLSCWSPIAIQAGDSSALTWRSRNAATPQHWGKYTAENREALGAHISNCIAATRAYADFEVGYGFDEFSRASFHFHN